MYDSKNDNKIEITKHAEKRIKERIGKKIPNSIAVKAMHKGIKHSDSSGSLHKYFTKLYFSYQTANNIRIYNQSVFIFRDEILITIMRVPRKYISVVNVINNKLKNCELSNCKLKLTNNIMEEHYDKV